MKISDIAGLSKPLTRLIEVISQGVGAVASPYLIRKTAEARAHEIKVIANTLQDVREQNQLPVIYTAGEIEVWQKPEDGTLNLQPTPIDQRINGRLEFQHRRRQNNIERVTTIAATELLQETTVPDEHPDEDWVSRFFNSAQDISSQEMQELWGRILAGEIRKPGSYSPRTLEFVKNLTKGEAEILEGLGKFALIIAGTAVIPVHDKAWLRDKRDIYPSQQFALGELGLMYPTNLTFQAFNDAEKEQEAFFSDDFILLIRRGGLTATVNLPIWKFTAVGKELLPLVNKPADEEYLELIAKFFVSRKAEAVFCRITKRHDNGEIEYDEIKPLGEPTDSPSPSSTPSSSAKHEN